MSAWSFEKPTEPGWYLFHGHPDAELKGILGEAQTEFVNVTRLKDLGNLLFAGPGTYGPKSSIGMWMRIDPAPLPKSLVPWDNLKVVHLNDGDLARVTKPPGEKWVVIGMDGENILGVRVPTLLVVPLWKPKSALSTYINALVEAHIHEEGCPPAQIIQYVRLSDGCIGLVAGGRVQSTGPSA